MVTMPETCHADGCSEPVEVTVYWPGKTTRQCWAHAHHAKEIATAMGFNLAIVPLVPVTEEASDGV